MSARWSGLLPAAGSLPVIPLVIWGVLLTAAPDAWRGGPFYGMGLVYDPRYAVVPLAVPVVLAVFSFLFRQRAAAAVNIAAFGLGLFFQVSLPLVRINRGGAVKGDLGAIRSALSIYYGDLDGRYPEGLEALTVGGKYMGVMPAADTQGRHPKSASAAAYGSVRDARDTGGWGYVGDPRSEEYGTMFIDCTHADPKGTVWTVY